VVLEDDLRTVLYIDGDPFRQCMYAVLALSLDVPGDSHN
jgi:hypothetical protein